ncbi:hypothetical protein PO124_26500 [Bacillus licheniformis]|nr:hypothetical protein [Bacillus licheniformis]
MDGMNKWQRFIYITLPLLKRRRFYLYYDADQCV